MTYEELVIKNREKLKIEIIFSIDNKTLRQSCGIYTNLHCDFGISETMFNAFYSSSKNKIRKQIAFYKKLTGYKMKLTRTNNSPSYTRLIYTMQG